MKLGKEAGTRTAAEPGGKPARSSETSPAFNHTGDISDI